MILRGQVRETGLDGSVKVANGGEVLWLGNDVPLGDHPAEYGMQAKYAKVAAGATNPFIDKANCFAEVDIQQAMYRAVLAEQEQKP